MLDRLAGTWRGGPSDSVGVELGRGSSLDGDKTREGGCAIPAG